MMRSVADDDPLHITAQVIDDSLWAVILRRRRLAVSDPLPATELVEQRLLGSRQHTSRLTRRQRRLG